MLFVDAFFKCFSSRRIVSLPDYMQGLVQQNEKEPVRSFSFKFRYMQHVISLNNSKLSDYVDRIHPIELKIKDTTDTAGSASYLDLYI